MAPPTVDEMAKMKYRFAMFSGGGSCMFACMGGPCGMEGTLVKVDDDTFYTPGSNYGCCAMGGCPCFPCCGWGPMAMAPMWKRDPDQSNKFVGTGPVYKGRCCGPMNNTGDVQIIDDNGAATFIPYSAMTPPCFPKGVPAGIAVPVPTGAPSPQTMKV